MTSSQYNPIEMERELLKATATGHLNRVLHVLEKNDKYFVKKMRKQRGHEQLSDGIEQHCNKKPQQWHSSESDSELDFMFNELSTNGHFNYSYKSMDNLTKKGKKNFDCSTKSRQKDALREAWSSIDNINCKDAEGSTPLHHACYTGSLEMAKFFISEGADVAAEDVKGNTPLHIAVQCLFEDISTLLRQAGGDMNALNNKGVTPFHIEAESKRRQKQNIEARRLKRQGMEKKKEKEEPPKKKRGPFRDWDDRWKQRRKKRMQSLQILAEEIAADRAWWESILIDDEDRHKHYENAWKKFSELIGTQFLSYSDVPFPVAKGKEALLTRIILHDAPPSQHKQLLRNEILRWHPDKFLQKYGHKFCDSNLEQLTDQVNELSQALNQLYNNV